MSVFTATLVGMAMMIEVVMGYSIWRMATKWAGQSKKKYEFVNLTKFFSTPRISIRYLYYFINHKNINQMESIHI